LLVLTWGSTYGATKEAIRNTGLKGHKAAHAHLRYINPFPKNLGDVLNRYKKVLIPELNLGHLASIVKSTFLKEVVQFNKVQGRPFKVAEIENKIIETLGGKNA